jgi:hypothetical protein
MNNEISTSVVITRHENVMPSPDTKVEEIIELFSGCGEHDPCVTEGFMVKRNLDYSMDKGEFSPLSQREYDFMHYGVGFTLALDGYSRYVRMLLIDGIKHINLSDDDYSSNDRIEQFEENATKAKVIYTEIAEAFGIELGFEYTKDGEYIADVFIPMSLFDFIPTAKEFEKYFLERKYLECKHAKKFKVTQAKI